jgi:predicted dienelactone hydrolase
VIIFSHGAGGSRSVGPELLKFWAAHGYVVLAATHEDNIQLQREQGKKASIDVVLNSFGTDPDLRISRVKDDKLLIDKLSEIAVLVPELAGKVDGTSIGVGGHSAGALTAVLMAGAYIDMPVNGRGGPEVEGLKDERVNATLLLSGQGVIRSGSGGALGGITEQSWLDCTAPMMVMTGSLDTSTRTSQTADSRQDPYRFAPPGDKYLLYIQGAAHTSFTGKAAGLEGPGRGAVINKVLGQTRGANPEDYDQEAIFSEVQRNSLAFWDSYLKGNLAAKAYLQSEAPGATSGGSVIYSRK